MESHENERWERERTFICLYAVYMPICDLYAQPAMTHTRWVTILAAQNKCWGQKRAGIDFVLCAVKVGLNYEGETSISRVPGTFPASWERSPGSGPVITIH